jgi:hypothetical protein
MFSIDSAAKQSPLAPLLPYVNESIYRIAPERGDELRAIIKARDIVGALDLNNPENKFEAWPGMGVVLFSLRGMERFWIYGAGTMFTYRAFQENGFQQDYSFAASPLGQEVQRLLIWATNEESWNRGVKWPVGSLVPGAHRDEWDVAKLADEIFLGAMGFVALHEIAHLELGHRANVDQATSIADEFAADAWAFDWIMSQWGKFSPDPRVFQKRTVLTAAVLALMASLRLYRKPLNTPATHPNPILRLRAFLEKHATPGNGLPVGLAWGVATTTLSIHLQHAPGYNVNQRWNDFGPFLQDIQPLFDH